MPSIYGVVTLPFSVREGTLSPDPLGINIFLDGKVPTENLRFRDESLTFKLAETADDTQVDIMVRIFLNPSVAIATPI